MVRPTPPTGAEALDNPCRTRDKAIRASTIFSRRLREAGDIVTTALGEERRQRLREEGAAMTLDEGVSYALANIDPKLLTGPILSAQD